ncbi:MAG: AbrB/MazE/SpoVT family DNA-binding domain-containing protein [Victivallales bacterium]|nr:AbrB/MazE/SpoVT family DNA-binding domain-containing protein [Victivallales bacterium]
METAKVFMTGRSQAVRIPKKYRFNTSEVQIQKKGNKIILSPIDRKKLLEKFLSGPAFPDFEVPRDDAQTIQERDLF